MAITKEQWERVEAELSPPYGSVIMKCDGFELTLNVTPVAALQYGIQVYVNGQFKGKWLLEECEERRRFLRPIERFFWSAKDRLKLLKVYGGKRAPKEEVERINRKFTYYATYWTSVKALQRHLKKQNRELQLVSIGGLPVVQEAATSQLQPCMDAVLA